MSDLVQRLSHASQPIVFGRPGAPDRLAELKAAIERKYVLLAFTETRGGTELGVPLDTAACDLSAADFVKGQGCIHLEGELRLDYVPVRLIAELDLATLQGQGQLRAASAAERS